MEKVFIDTNVIIELLRGKKGVISFFRKVEDGYIEGLTNIVVFLETVHVYTILLTDEGPLNLKKKPDLLKSVDLSPVLKIFEILKILPVKDISNEEIARVVNEFGLLPNDALIASTCKHHGIKKIATFDEDFKRIDFLEIITP